MGRVDDRFKDPERAKSKTAKRWQAVWIEDTPDGRRRERTKAFANKEDARAYWIRMESEQQRGEYISRSDPRTVAEYAREWAATRPHGPRTVRRVDSLIRTHLEGTPLGGRRLADVRHSEVQAWATGRSKVLAPLSLRTLVSLLRSVYAAAVADRLVASSPCARLELPSARRERVDPLTVDQVKTLAAALPPRNRAMVLVQAGLGLRIGELLALRLEDVDFLRRTVRIEWQIAPGERTRCRPKTQTSRRTIPLPDFVGEALSEHVRQFPPAADGTLFTTQYGSPYSHDYYGAQIFKRAVRATAGIPDSTSTHDLRHHYASVLLLAGESVIAVAARLGHENGTLVLSTYGHLMPGTEDRTRRALDNAWSAPADSATDQRRTEDQP